MKLWKGVLKLTIKYTIQKHKQLDKFVLWKETKTEHGIGFRGIFQGTKKECEEYLKKIKGE